MADEKLPSTRAQAKALGLHHYFTGKPCKHGHISARYAEGGCVECQRQYQKDYLLIPEKREARRESDRRQARSEKRKRKRRERRNKARELAVGRSKPLHCEVCGEQREIHFDHCHDSGLFRGWVCERCNNVLGLVKDNPVLLENLARYLRNSFRRIDQMDWIVRTETEDMLLR